MVTSDAALIDRIRSGERDAFGPLFERYHARCVRLALQLLGDPDDAADAVQDAFIRAYLSIDRYEERERFGSWLMCIVANRCRSASHAARRRAYAGSQWWATVAEVACEPEERDHALARHVAAAMDTLPSATRTAILNKYACDLTYGEIAAVTGADVSALKMRVARGSAQLRRALVGAGITLTAAVLISLGAAPARIPRRPVALAACDTLRTIMRDTLDAALADSILPARRCGINEARQAEDPTARTPDVERARAR